MIKVKISIGWHKNTKGTPPYGEDLSIFNFTNSKENIFNDKKYYINSKVDNPDYWFVLENTRFNSQENTSIAKDKLYFLNSETRYEPSYFLKPSKELFLKQFDKVYSPNFINMNNVKNAPPYLMWRLRGDPFDDINDVSDIEFFKNLSIKKDALLSVYCTTKQITEIQKVRLDFVKKLKKLLGDDLHWYGADNKTENKIEGIGKYKYHLVLENQISHNFISEKLYDSFLGNAYPIYSGAPNADDYFEKNSFLTINLNDFNGSIQKILGCINNNNYEKNIESLKRSKLVTLEKFNLIKRIDSIVENNLEVKESLPTIKTIYPKVYFENKSRFARILFSINQRVKKIYMYLESFYS
jgi:hypothetical protein